MSAQATLFDFNRAHRASDPETSRQAAAKDRTPLRAEVLRVFRGGDWLTDDELAARIPAWPASSVKTARSALTRAGFLEFAGSWGLSNTGSRMRVWRSVMRRTESVRVEGGQV